MASIKVRAKLSGETTTVKALMSHPMETGLRKDKKTGKLIPAHFIQEVTAQSGGKTVLSASWGGAISKNPYLSFKFNGGEPGDTIEIEQQWRTEMWESYVNLVRLDDLAITVTALGRRRRGGHILAARPARCAERRPG